VIGRRVEFFRGWPASACQPGDYCKVPDGIDPRGGGWWYCIAPTGHQGAIGPPVHTVVEHEDGTISVTPSLVFDTVPEKGYHGHLTGGVWT
jgi:hypothetical protein